MTAREGDTLLSLTNERGTEEATLTGRISDTRILGQYVGHCVLGDYLVVFTHDTTGDYIFRIEKKEGKTFEIVCLTGYKNSSYKPLSLGFDPDHPMQTLGVYENIKIQKVYWTDGVRQPRVINITKEELIGYEPYYNENSFDFVPAMELNDKLSVRKIISSSGSFDAGVVQYFISYFNKYGQESNISLQSPLIPTSFLDRAGKADETVGNCFEITVENPDCTNFEYLRIYSMFRSEIEGECVCKRVADIKLTQSNSDDGEVKYDNPKYQQQVGILQYGNDQTGIISHYVRYKFSGEFE